MDPSTTPMSISCSVVLLPYHGSSLRSHTYLNVLIQPSYLFECDGIMVITAANLLNALRTVSYAQDGVPMPLKDIIFGTTNPVDIVAATTQVPSFDDDIENPSYGYRCLGVLSSIDIRLLAAFDPNRDLLAVHSNDTPRTDLFYQKWRRCGLNLATHFILIFRNTSSPPPLPAITQPWNASPFTHHGFSSPSCNGSYDSPPGFQTPSLLSNERSNSETGHFRSGSYNQLHRRLTSLVALNERNNGRGSESGHSGTASPSPFNDRAGAEVGFFRRSSTEGLTTVISDHQDWQTPNHMSNNINEFPFSSCDPPLSESMPHDIEHPPYVIEHQPHDIEHSPHDIEHSPHNIEHICRDFGLSEDAINNAKFEKGEEKSLLRLVLNQRSMAHVLVTLEFQTHLDDVFVGSKAVTLKGQRFTASDIVKFFGWSTDSYRNKTTWFGWAKQAAKSQKWSGSVPTQDSPQNMHNLYHTWLGIRGFWGPRGPAETEMYPEGASDSDIDIVRKLRQNSISANRSALVKLLVRCDSEAEMEDVVSAAE